MIKIITLLSFIATYFIVGSIYFYCHRYVVSIELDSLYDLWNKSITLLCLVYGCVVYSAKGNEYNEWISVGNYTLVFLMFLRAEFDYYLQHEDKVSMGYLFVYLDIGIIVLACFYNLGKAFMASLK